MSYGLRSENQGQRVTELLEKCSHYDKDERYMATNDLCNELIKGLAMDEPLEQRICTAILKQMDDQSNDVQSVAVKCLGILFKRIHLVQMEKIADKLCKHILQGNESLRDIYAIGLKTLLADIPEELGANIAERLATQLLNGISDKKAGVEVKRECIDILSELLRRFGRCVQTDHERIMNVLLSQLQEARAVIKKRASICLGSLSTVISDELLDLMVKIILQQISKAETEKYPGHLLAIRTYIHSIGMVSRCVGRRLRNHLVVMIPLFLRFCGRPADQEEDNEDFDEMVENCFSGVTSFVTSCPPRDISPYLVSILEVAMLFLSYDPNFCFNDEDEEAGDMDVDADEDEDYGDMEEDMMADDDDHSWKARKAAAHVITAVIRHGQLASEHELVGSGESAQRCVGDLLISRFRERVENVRLDVLEGFSALIKRFSATTSLEAGSDMDVVEDGTATSNHQANEADSAHVKFFVDRTSVIAKKCSQLFAGPGRSDDTKTRVAAIGIIRVLAGGMQGYVNLLTPDLLDALRACLSDAQQSVKLEAVVCLRQIFHTHAETHLDELQRQVSTFLPAVQALVSEDWYKLTIEGLRLFNAFVVSLRPALPHDATHLQYSSACSLSPAALGEAAQFIFAAVIGHVSGHDSDQEVRDSALVVLGSLVAHCGDILLTDPARADQVFSLLLKRIENEVTRMAAMRALIKVASSQNSRSFAASSAIVSHATFASVTRLLGQQDRSLRQTALRLLNALVCMHPERVESLSPAQVPLFADLLNELIALMSEADLFICNLAINVAHNLVLRSGGAKADHSVLLARAVALMSSPLLPENVVGELKALLSELAKGGLSAGANSPLVIIVTQLMESTLEGAARGLSAGAAASDTAASGGPTNRAAMANASSCVAAVVLSANQSQAAPSAISVRDLALRMLNMVITGTDPVADQLVAKGTVVQSKALQEACVQFGLLAIGDLGRAMDVVALTADAGTPLFDAAFGLVDNPSEEIKHAAAACLGNLAIGNSSNCLQRLIATITGDVVLVAAPGDVNAQHRMLVQHALLSALKIVISSHHSAEADRGFVNAVLHPCLLAFCTSSDESVRSVVADCLGALMVGHTDMVVPALLDIVNKQGPMAASLTDQTCFFRAQWTVATALRHGLARRSTDVASYLRRSKEITDVFFTTLYQTDEAFDLDVRKASLLLLNTLIAHNKEVIDSYMEPSSRVFLAIKDSISFKRVYKVDLGPYKHEVDDGIPLRKAALTCLETLLLGLPQRFQAGELIAGLLARLGDKDGMIKLQTYQVLSRAFSIDPAAFSMCDPESLIKPLEKAIFNDTVFGKGDAKSGGDNNVRPMELMRGALRVVLSVEADSLLLAPGSQKAWSAFNDKITSTAEVVSVVEQIRQEMGSK